MQSSVSRGLVGLLGWRICQAAANATPRCANIVARPLSSAAARERMEYDVCIVGAGPAGLSAAIRLKQQCKEHDKELSVCIIEKGSEVGAHILSGNVLEPRALDELLPGWKEDPTCPINTPVKKDAFYVLTKNRAWRLPTPPTMWNKGNYVISLSEVCRWLGTKAEELGVDIFPGFPGSQILYSWDGAVEGVVTGDFGVAKDGTKKDTYAPGVELKAKATLLAEGCRGSLSQQVLERYRLREKAGAQHQTYALGLKEVWEVPPEQHTPGLVYHTVGWPSTSSTYTGGFLYGMSDNRVAVGYVIGLDYSNPHLNTFKEFQLWKTHPLIRKVLEGGTCLQYGARTLNEGGFQSVPGLTFPGGALVGCAAGFLNVAKIKGTHTAMFSGMLAGEAAYRTLTDEKVKVKGPVDLSTYEKVIRQCWVMEELERTRNIRPGFRLGLWPGLMHAAVDNVLLRGQAPWTLRHGRPDHEHLQLAKDTAPKEYPKPDGTLTFDLPTQLYRSGTTHNHDQPAHLQLRDAAVPELVNKPHYDGPETRYCPAGVYEYAEAQGGRPQLVINAQNCLHCKACDIKDPRQNIKWTTPEGGGGPGYNVT